MKKIYELSFNSAYDYKTDAYKHFKNLWDAVSFAQAYKMNLKQYMIIKVDDHYEIH